MRSAVLNTCNERFDQKLDTALCEKCRKYLPTCIFYNISNVHILATNLLAASREMFPFYMTTPSIYFFGMLRCKPCIPGLVYCIIILINENSSLH